MIDDIPDWVKYPVLLQFLQIVYLVVKRVLFGTQSESKGINVVISLAIVHLAGFWGILQFTGELGLAVIVIYCIFAFLAFIVWLTDNSH